MPSAAELKLEMRPLGMRARSKFDDLCRYEDEHTISHIDQERIEKTFKQFATPEGLLNFDKLQDVLKSLHIECSRSVRKKFLQPFQEEQLSESQETKEIDDNPESKRQEEMKEQDFDKEKHEDEQETVEEEEEEEEGESEEKAESKEEKHNNVSIDFNQFCHLLSRLFAPHYIYGREFNRAAARGDVPAMKHLVDRGCDPNCKDGRGMTALHYASESGNIASVKYLLDVICPQVIDAQDANGWTALMCAASNGKTALVSLLLRSKANARLKSCTGRTALCWACVKGHRETCQVLLSAPDAGIGEPDNYGMTPLHYAALGQDKLMAAWLMKSGAKSDCKDFCGRRPEDMCDQDLRETIFGSNSKKK